MLHSQFLEIKELIKIDHRKEGKEKEQTLTLLKTEDKFSTKVFIVLCEKNKSLQKI